MIAVDTDSFPALSYAATLKRVELSVFACEFEVVSAVVVATTDQVAASVDRYTRYPTMLVSVDAVQVSVTVRVVPEQLAVLANDPGIVGKV